MAVRAFRRHFQTSSIVREKKKYERDTERSFLNIGTLGGYQHGKTSLASCLTKHSSLTNPPIPSKTVAEIDSGKNELANKHTENPTHLEVATERFHAALTDLPGNMSFVKNLLNHLFHLDAVLLVVRAEEGVLEETKLFYKFARHVGIDNVIPVINYSDAAEVEESADLIKMELSEAFDEEGDTKSIGNVVVGNFADPKENEIKNLVSAIDLIEVPSRKDGEPLVWPLENVGSIPNRGTFIAGRILAGEAKVGSAIDVFYNGNVSKANVRDCEVFRRSTTDLKAGERGGAFVKLKVDPFDLKRGGVAFDRAKTDRMIGSEWKIELKDEFLASESTLIKSLVAFHDTSASSQSDLELESVGGSSGVLKTKSPILVGQNQPLVIRSTNGFLRANFVRQIK